MDNHHIDLIRYEDMKSFNSYSCVRVLTSLFCLICMLKLTDELGKMSAKLKLIENLLETKVCFFIHLFPSFSWILMFNRFVVTEPRDQEN